uniref:Putative nitrate/sulfonate/bicarbonate family ABC transporter substrate-binding protein n=1 Tax=uncultured bacterium fosmid pJB190D12_contig I TaxID=1478059 RepID=A0A0H3U8R3_9BACT|nr:putative nitrate/sulfonate/bicarbonate family ABC transporter substrate-binding protein [uncultured bacterium fosmid pJB190D12_contig I]
MGASASVPSRKRFATPRARTTDGVTLRQDANVPDELECPRARVIDAGPGKSDGLQEIDGGIPARLGHREEPRLHRFAGIDQREVLHLAPAVGEQLVAHLRVVLPDERVAGRGIREVAPPALRRGAQESRQHVTTLLQRVARDDQRLGVRGIAQVGEQEHRGLHAGLLDRERLGGDEALLREPGIGEKRLHRERVGPLLVVGEAVALLQPGPERGVARGADRDRPSLEVFEPRDAGMRDDHRRVLLERRTDRDDGHVLLDRGEDLQTVTHRDVDPSGGEELQAVHLRAAHADRHVEAVLAVRALGYRLVEAAVLGLREPVGREQQPVLRVGDAAAREDGGKGAGNACDGRLGHARPRGRRRHYASNRRLAWLDDAGAGISMSESGEYEVGDGPIMAP